MARFDSLRPWFWHALILLGCSASLGCKREQPEPVGTAEHSQVAPAHTEKPDASTGAGHAPTAPGHPAGTPPSPAAPVGAISWDVPPGFRTMPPRPMRQATYQAEGVDGPVEIAVFYFGAGQGGDVEANISRWVGQFQDVPEGGVKRREEELNGLRRTHVEIARGTFSTSMPGGPASPQKDWGMSASIVETASGSYFFKMTGPAGSVAAQKEAFARLLSSITAKQ